MIIDTEEIVLFTRLNKIAMSFINDIYKFFIDRYNLKEKEDIITFFQLNFTTKDLLAYLYKIKDKIALQYALTYQFQVESLNQFAIDIYNFFVNNEMLLFNLNKFIIANLGNYIDKYKQKYITANINNIDDNKIISLMEEYIISESFFAFILNKSFIKNMQDISDVCTNIDINLIKEFIKINCYEELYKKASTNMSIEEFYQYIFSQANIINKIKQYISKEFDRQIYNNFFMQGKYLDKLTQASELFNLKDEIKQQTYIIRTDVNNRDKAFVDIDHHILVSETGENHSQLFNRYTQEKKGVRLYNGKRRPKVKDIQAKTDIKCWAYGHISNKVYLIDGVYNMTDDEVINDLKKFGILEKIYSFQYANGSKYYGTATREARRLFYKLYKKGDKL